MKRKVFYFGIVILVMATVAFLLVQLQNSDSNLEKTGGSGAEDAKNAGPANASSETPEMKISDDKTDKVRTQNGTERGIYIDYSETKFTDSANQTRVLFFYDSWLPQSQALDTDLKLHTLPSGLVIFKVGYDNSQVLKQKYGVKLQPTLVKVDANGGKIKSIVASDEPTYASVKKMLDL